MLVLQVTNAGVRRPGYETTSTLYRYKRPGNKDSCKYKLIRHQ